MMAEMAVTAVAPWFGSNRMLGPEVGKALAGCSWVGIPFAGGMAEVPHIKANVLVVNDLHRHVINLAQMMAAPIDGPILYRQLRRMTFDQKTLDEAREYCLDIEAHGAIDVSASSVGSNWRLVWAKAYFISCWMGRSSKAGTKDEFKGGLALRWDTGGGDSAVRFKNAVLGIPAWRRTLRRCTFSTLDFRVFLRKCLEHDEPHHGIYCDPPFPGPGDAYKHTFTEQDHRDLAGALTFFDKAKVVCRFYDVPMIRAMYPEGTGPGKWRWKLLDGGRTQANKKAPEVLLCNQ